MAVVMTVWRMGNFGKEIRRKDAAPSGEAWFETWKQQKNKGYLRGFAHLCNEKTSKYRQNGTELTRWVPWRRGCSAPF